GRARSGAAMTTGPGPAAAIAEGSTALEWTFDPWPERPAAAIVASVAVAAFWLGVAALRLPTLLAVALDVIAASPLLPAFVPAACRVSADGAARRGLLGWERRRWTDVRRLEDRPVGGLLSPVAERHWLDATRAFTLPMPAPHRAELREAVRQRWGARGG